MNTKNADKSSSGRWVSLTNTGGGTSSDLRQSVKTLQEQAAKERKIFSGEPSFPLKSEVKKAK